MTEPADRTQLLATLTAIEPAVRMVPARALRRVIRHSRDRGDLDTRVVHEHAWWIARDQLFEILTPWELNLSPAEPFTELLLLPEPNEPISGRTLDHLRQALFHAGVDHEIDRAVADRRLTSDRVRAFRQQLGPAQWHEVREVLTAERLIDGADTDLTVIREFAAFALDLHHYAPHAWPVYFPGLREPAPVLDGFREFVDSEAISRRVGAAALAYSPSPPVRSIEPEPVVEVPPDLLRRAEEYSERGNDLGAAVLLAGASSPAAERYLDRLVERVRATLDLPPAEIATWKASIDPLLRPAAAGGWTVERRLLYELQRACLTVERQAYAAELVEWAVTLGRKSIKRPLTKTVWLDVTRHLRAALAYSERLPGTQALGDRIEHAMHAAEARAREVLRPDIVAVLDEVGLIPWSVPERLSREKLVEELLDGACARGFIRIGDLRDAIARNRVKLADLAGPGEWLRGDPLIRANRELAFRLDGVYRRGEFYMRLLQRMCSLFFGTQVGRWLTLYLALPFGGAFVLIEAFHHMVGAGEGLVNWLTGYSASVEAFPALAGGAAGTLAANPDLGRSIVNWPTLAVVGVFLFLMLHWPAFRSQVAAAAKFVFVKVPRAVRRSPLIRALVHNPVTRFFRRYVLIPLTAGSAAALSVIALSGDTPSIGLIGGGVALFSASFFRTPFGRTVEDRLNEVADRVWRIVSVNFVVGLLTYILQFFRAVLETIDRAIYAVDEWLRFREGESRGVFVFKLVFGLAWFLFSYLFRFAWNLLVEPQINPIKHFPVVTVSHKLLLPLIPSLARQFGVSDETMGTIVFGIPGIFGFLVWELKENWKLYRANAPAMLRPAVIGSHGERMRGLLRPGFHSGVVPKAYAKWRTAVRTAKERKAAKARHTLEHVAEALHRLAERDVVAYLRVSQRWDELPIRAGHPELATNRVRMRFAVAGRTEETTVSFEERGGWVIGSVEDAGWLPYVSDTQRSAFQDVLVGLYKRSGVHAVREQAAHMFGPAAHEFDAVPEGLIVPTAHGDMFFEYDDGPELRAPTRGLPSNTVVLSECPVTWADWVDRWDADAAGKSPRASLVPGWTFLPETRPS